ncbi:MAG: hypothetical protein ACR2OZ_10840 [Verrucomicrobiales bacterium]
MIDRDHLEQAGFEALGLLEDAECAEFQREYRVNAELIQVSREMRDLVALIGATVPLQVPSPRHLDIILQRIGHEEVESAAVTTERSTPSVFWRVPNWVPWSAAAGFALLAAGIAWQSKRADGVLVGGRQLGVLQSAGEGQQPSEERRTDGELNPNYPLATSRQISEGLTRAALSRTPPRFFINRPGDAEIRLQQDSVRLKGELDKLRAVEDARQQLPSGVSDLRVVEMRPPGARLAEAKRDLLGPRVAEALATGLSAPAVASSETSPKIQSPSAEPVRLSGRGAHPSTDITIESGLLNIAALNLHPDAQVIHQNFPRPEEFGRYGLTPLDRDTAWDGQGGLWHRSADGRTWIGQKAPPNWQPPDPDEASSATAPTLRPAAASEVPQPSIDGGEAPAAQTTQPYALPILDHNGQGTLIVQNLPPAPEGQAYHLWLRDPRFPDPINIGVLPPMESSSDHFGFDLGAPGFVPTGYLLTLEAKGAATSPQGKIVLQGP